MYIGIIVFPLLSVIAFIGSFIQYGVSLARLNYVCEDTHIINEKPGLFLFAFSTVAAFAAFITYPNGALWVMFFPNYLPNGFVNCSMTGAIYRL